MLIIHTLEKVLNGALQRLPERRENQTAVLENRISFSD
jgi:hypothetical protein